MVSTVASQQEGPGFESIEWSLFLLSLNVLCLCGFSVDTCDIHVRVTGHSKFPIGVNVGGKCELYVSAL